MTRRGSTSTRHEDRVRQAWDAIANRFDEYMTPMTVAIGDCLAARLGVVPGTRFLDMGAGTGGLAIPAARRGAEVVAVDIAPTMIERLRIRGAAEGLANVEARVMDGCAADLPAGSFDVAASLNGVSLFPDLRRGLGELVRVTQTDGQVMVAAFGEPQRAEFLGFFSAALQCTVPGFSGREMDTPPSLFRLADPDRLRRVLTRAGLGEVAVTTIAWPMHFRSGHHMWDVVTASSPFSTALVADLTDEQCREARYVLHGMLRDRSGGPGATLNTELNVATGTKRGTLRRHS